MSILNIANELNNLFNADEFDLENHDIDNEIFNILNDELSNIDDDDIIYSGGHYDEQTLSQYLDARDEDGNYLHPYNKEEFI